MAVGNAGVQLLVLACKANRLEMAVEHRNQMPVDINLIGCEIIASGIRLAIIYVQGR